MVMDSKGFIYLVDDNTVRIIDPEFKVITIARIEGNFQRKRKKSSLHFSFDTQMHFKKRERVALVLAEKGNRRMKGK